MTQASYELFKSELETAFYFYDYGFSKGKEISCSWILDRITSGNAIDIGGTTSLVNNLRKKFIACSYFDAFPSSEELVPLPDTKMIVGDIHSVLDLTGLKSFDNIICRHTLEHAMNPMFVLWSFNKILKDDGSVYIIVPRHAKHWVWFYTHFSCLPLENYLMLFYRAGFKVIEHEVGFWDDEQKNRMEDRFHLKVDSRFLRLNNPEGL